MGNKNDGKKPVIKLSEEEKEYLKELHRFLKRKIDYKELRNIGWTFMTLIIFMQILIVPAGLAIVYTSASFWFYIALKLLLFVVIDIILIFAMPILTEIYIAFLEIYYELFVFIKFQKPI